MRVVKSDWVAIGYLLYVAGVAIVTSYGVGLATSADLLIPLAAPIGLGVVAVMFWLPPRVQQFGWAGITVWLLSTTYLGTGSAIEYVALAVVILLSIAGVFWSPWFLVAAWLFHPIWDLIPRDLPDPMHDLPLACLIYDLIVALYLVWRISRKFFPETVSTEKALRTGLRRSLVALYVSCVFALSVLGIGFVSMETFSVWLAIPAALLIVAPIMWLPNVARLGFFAVATAWMGMTFAHSGSPLEIAIFLVILGLAVLGFRVSPLYLSVAWVAHALWSLVPHQMNHASALLMGHWMDLVAAFLYEISIGIFIAIATWRGFLVGNRSLSGRNGKPRASVTTISGSVT